jgi:hypothetical protein
MTKRDLAIGALALGVVALWPLLFGVWAMLTAPADRITGADWSILGLYLLCAALGGALIAGGFLTLRSGTKQ